MDWAQAALNASKRAALQHHRMYCGDGNLLSGFISPRKDQCTDADGGSLENCMALFRSAGFGHGARALAEEQTYFIMYFCSPTGRRAGSCLKTRSVLRRWSGQHALIFSMFWLE